MRFRNTDTSDKAELDALGRSLAVIHFSPEGVILSANDNFLNAMGYRREEVIGQHHRIFCEPTYAQSAEYKEFWKRLGDGEYNAAQFKRLAKGGREIWIEASYNPILDKSGNVISVVKYATDITKQKLYFADCEGQIAAINRAQAVIEFNMDGSIRTANENFLKTMGYSLGEIAGRHHSIFADPAYAKSEEYKKFWQRLNNGEYFVDEFQRYGKGGKEVWIQASYNPIMDMNGRPFKVVKYASDITEQKLNAADVKGQLEAVSKSQAIIEFNLDGTIRTANKNFLNALGYTLEEIKGKHHRMFVEAAEANTPEYAAFWQKLGRGKYDASLYRRIKKGGADIWIQASYNPIFDPSGQPYKVVKFATDVTKTIQSIKIAEAAVGDLSSVAAAVEEMTASIAEISRNMNMSREASSSILTDSNQSSSYAQQLNEKMKNMKSIVDLIGNIASQVNLLALNATIEAARAGDAGKGFAVVAAEVKNLATQTTRATEDISHQIHEIQASSNNVVSSIDGIASSASNMNHYITGVASAIEEQTAVTSEISTNVQKVSHSMQQISDSRTLRNAA